MSDEPYKHPFEERKKEKELPVNSFSKINERVWTDCDMFEPKRQPPPSFRPRKKT